MSREKSMSRICSKCTMILVLLIGLFLGAAPAARADTARELQLAVQTLTVFLGHERPDSQNWRRFLYLNVLETQAAKGHAADTRELARVLPRFRSGVSGLDHPLFIDVRMALERHLATLSWRDQVTDLDSAIAQARRNVRPITVEQIAYWRDRAIYDLYQLKRWYHLLLDAESQNQVFERLKVDEMIETLRGIVIEVPSVRTAELIDSEIQSAQDAIQKIDGEIDNMNRQVDQINEWLKQLRIEREKRSGESPVPDDDNRPPSQTQSRQESDRQQQKQGLESNLQNLQINRQQLQQRIEQLQQEKQDLAPNERERLRRRTQIAQLINPYQRDFEDLVLQQRDIHFAAAFYSYSRFRRVYANGTRPQGQLQRFVDAGLNTLAANYQQLSDPDNRIAQADVGRALGDLDESLQAVGLVSAVRQRYSGANLHVSVSGDLINRLGARPVSEPSPVREEILGRLILGQACLNGNVRVDLVPDPNQANLSLQLLGNVDSNNYTTQGPITAYSSGQAMVEARRSLLFNTSGFYLNDVYAAANLTSQFQGVSSRLRLINRLAEKQYQKDRYLSEGIGAGRLEQKLTNQYGEQIDEQLNENMQQLNQVHTRRKENLGLLPDLYFATTDFDLQINGKKSTGNDLAATIPMQATPVDPEIAVRVHESALSNFASPLVAGRALWNYEIADRLEEALGADMSALREAENENWRILFSNKRPIQIELDDNRISLVVTGLQFQQEGGGRIRNGLRIRLAFKVVESDGALLLLRDGDAVVDYVSGRDAATVAFKSALERQLNKGLQDGSAQEIVLPPDLIPGEAEGVQETPVTKSLRLIQLRAEDGWLYVGWNQVADGTDYRGPIDKPAIWPSPE